MFGYLFDVFLLVLTLAGTIRNTAQTGGKRLVHNCCFYLICENVNVCKKKNEKQILRFR